LKVNKVTVLKEILSTSFYLLCVLGITFFIINFVGQRTQVLGASMEATLFEGDNLIIDKISYRFTEPERFDIIVFPYQYTGDNYIKRIIGLPGETVSIDGDGIIYINGEELEESYGKEVIYNPGVARDELVLGDEEYFVLGDNRNNSSDSREPSIGNIQKDSIIGKAFIRIWPLIEFGILSHQEEQKIEK